MRALTALLAVAGLLGLVYVGVGLAGQQYLFGIVIPYVAIVVFLVALIAAAPRQPSVLWCNTQPFMP